MIKATDIGLMGLACVLAAAVVPHAAASNGAYLVAGAAGTLLAFMCILQARIYTRRSLQAATIQVMSVLPCLLVGAAAQAVVLWILQADQAVVIIRWSLAGLIVSAVLISIVRIPLAYYVRAAIAAGFLARRVAIIGATPRGYAIAERTWADRTGADRLIGIFDDEPVEPAAYKQAADSHARVLGGITDLVALSRRERIDVIFITLPAWRMNEIDSLRAQLSCVVADVYFVPDIAGVLPPSLTRDPDVAFTPALDGSPAISLLRRPLNDRQSLQKALFDRAAAAALLVLLSPVLLLIALAVKLDSRGPVIFRQPRMGFNNVPFTVFKFRSMYHHMADLMADRQTSRGDPRVTRVGRILRKLSFDELPQLMNVLRGDMSLVGPRPHAPSTKAEGLLLADAVPSYAERHRIKPGITGWAQVNGARGEIRSIRQIEDRVRFDLHYMRNWSLLLDIKILFLTVKRELVSSRAF